MTKAKRGGLANRRLCVSELHSQETVVKHLFDVIAPAMKDRPGGYTRIIKAGRRHGDNAPMAYIQFVGFEYGSPFHPRSDDRILDGK